MAFCKPRKIRTASRWRARPCVGLPCISLPLSACLALEIELAHDPVAAGFLGKIERAVAAIDQIRHRLAVLELSDADRYRDLRKDFSGGAAGDLPHTPPPAIPPPHHPP